MVTSGDYQRSEATKRIRVPFVVFCNQRGPFLSQSGLKWALYAFFFLAFPAHGDPRRLDAIAMFCPLIGIITAKYEMMARKRKKADAQMTEISVSADGDFANWRYENDGDSVLMTESGQVWYWSSMSDC